MNGRNKSIFALVYKLSITDANIATEEFNYLKDIASNLALTSNDMEEISANPDGFPFSPPPKEQERMKILYYMLFAIRIDGKISKREEAFVTSFALRLGFHEAMVKDFVAVMKDHLTTKLPDDALMNIIRKYVN